MESEIYYLTYTSTITFWGAISPFTFKHIEKVAQHKNAQQHIKGFLLFKDGKFFQYIEGSRTDIEHLYQVLLNDIRHKNLKKLTTGTRSHYLFKNWYMYFFRINKNDTINPISQLFESFDSYRWQTNTVNQLIDDVKHYHDNQTK